MLIGSRSAFPAFLSTAYSPGTIAPPLGGDVTLAAGPADPAALIPARAGAPNLDNRIDPTTGAVNYTRTGLAGAGDRISDFVHSPAGAGALLRAGATMLGGGNIGQGIAAGAGYVDNQKALAGAAQQQQFDDAIKAGQLTLDQQRAQNQDALGWGNIDVALRGQREASRHNQAQEGLTGREQNITMRGQDNQLAMNTANNETSRANTADNNATSRANNAATTGASIYGDNLTYLGKQAAGIGSKGNGYTETTTTTKGQPGSSGWFSNTPATPTVTQTVRTPADDSGGAPAAAAGAPVVPGPADIAALKASPNLRGQFDQKFGAGAASQYLGGR